METLLSRGKGKRSSLPLDVARALRVNTADCFAFGSITRSRWTNYSLGPTILVPDGLG